MNKLFGNTFYTIDGLIIVEVGEMVLHITGI